MTERTVAVKLDANVQGYLAAMSRASVATKQFADKASIAVGKNREGINNLSRTSGLLGGAIALGVGAAVKSYADFDSALSGVAATGQDARQNLNALRAAAIKAGADTKYSATQAAEGQEALAKANVSAKDSLGGGLAGALNLAASGNLSVAESADVAAIAMNQFKLQGKDVPHIADLLAAGAGKAAGELSDMSMAFKQTGLVASQTGLSIEETTGGLAAFANAGLIGSDAGTSFKTMLQSLTPTSVVAKNTMAKLGISAYDAQGNFIGLAGFADNLRAGLKDLSVEQQNAALKTIFGSDAVRAASVLYQEGGDGIRKWTDAVNDQGFAAEQARIKMDNLKGDLEQLSGSFETAVIGLGEGSDGPLRSLVQNLTAGVNGFNDLDSSTKSTFLAVAAGVGGTLLAAAAVGKLAIASNDAKVALKGLGISAKAAGLATLGVATAIGVAAFAYGKWATQQAESKQRVEDFTTALQSQTDAIQANVTQVAAKQLRDAGALQAARDLGLNLDTVTKAALGNAAAVADVTAALDQMGAADQKVFEQGLNSSDPAELARVETAKAHSAALRLVATSIGTTSSEYNKAVQDAKDFDAATKGAGEASAQSAPKHAQSAGALHKLAAESADAKKQLDDMVESLFAAADAAIGLSDAQIGYEQAVDAAAKAAKDNKHSLDLNTKAGQDNQTALNRLAGASHRYIEQLVGQGASTKKVEGATKDARAEFIKVAEKMGASSTEAKRLADKYGLIPKDVKTNVTQPGMPKAKTDTKKLYTQLQDLARGYDVNIGFSSNIDKLAAKYGITIRGSSKSAAKRTHGDARGGLTGRDVGGMVPGHTPLWKGDDYLYPLADGRQQPLRGGEGIYVTEAMDDPYEKARMYAVNQAALRGESLSQFQAGLAAGGITGHLNIGVGNFPARQMPAVLDQIATKFSQDVGDALGRGIGAKLQKLLGDSVGGGGAFGGVGAAGAGHMARAALAQVGSTAWGIAMCLKFVRTMAGAPGGTYDAVAAWRNARFKHPGDRNPPSSSSVFWGGGHGHVAAGEGGGRIATTDFPRMGRIGLTTIGRLTSAWHKPYLGWTNDINGVVTTRYGLPAKAATGGLLRGPGSGTSDSIPLWGSNGEYMVNAAATARFLPLLEHLNAQGLATGGPVLRRTQNADVMRLIAALTAPLNDIARAFRDVNLRNREAAQAHRGAVRADNLLDRTVDRRVALGRRVNHLEREARATKGVTRADKELKKARHDLEQIDKVVEQRERAKAKAIDLSSEAKRRATEATQKLAEVQRQLADVARQVSDQFAGQYQSTSTDVRDWIELMHTGSTDLIGFTKQIGQLRRSGLSETLIQQIIGLGAVAGGDVAAQIAAGGSGLVAQLNAATKGLQAAADALGYIGSAGRKRLAGGGPVIGAGTGTSDSVNIRASNGEWVVPARAVQANRPYLEAITYGRHVVAHNYARSHYAGGGYVNAGRGLIDTDAVKAALAGMSVYVQNPWTGEYHEARMEGVSMRVMDRETGKVATSF